MKVADAVAVAGHEVHVCRYREARTLLRWLGEDLRGLRVLDVAAGDGYWAAQTRKRASGRARPGRRQAQPRAPAQRPARARQERRAPAPVPRRQLRPGDV